MINYKVRIFEGESSAPSIIEHQTEIRPQVGDVFAIESDEEGVFGVFAVKRVVFPIHKAYEHNPSQNGFYVDVERDYYV